MKIDVSKIVVHLADATHFLYEAGRSNPLSNPELDHDCLEWARKEVEEALHKIKVLQL